MPRLRSTLLVLSLVYPVADAPGWPAAAQAPREQSAARGEVGLALPEGAVVRIGSLRLRHRGAVRSLAFLPDGRGLVSLGADNDFHLWDAATGAETRWLRKTVESPRRSDEMMEMMMMMRMRGRRMGPRGMRFIEAEYGGPQATAFSPDGKLLAVGELSGTVRVWDTASDREVKRFQVKEPSAHPIAFSADGKRLAAGGGGQQGTVHVWDVADGKEVWQLRSPQYRPVRQFLFAPNGSYLIGAAPNELRVWDLAKGKRVRVYQGQDHGGVMAFAISPDGKRVASAGQDQLVRLWDDSSEEEVGQITVPGGLVTAMAFSPDGKVLATGSDDQPIRLWEVASTKEVKRFGGPGVMVATLAFAPDGKTLAAGSLDGAIRLWDVAKGTERIAAGDAAAPVSVAFVEGGRRIALGSADGAVRHCDPLTGKVLHRFDPEGKGAAVVFAPGCRVAAVTAEDGPVVVRDVVNGKELCRLKGVEGSASLTFSPDGRLLLVASDDGEEKMMMRGGGFKFGGRFVPGGEVGGKTRLLDAATGKELRSLGDTGGAALMVFAPGGRALATVGEEGLVRLWELTTGKERGHFRGPRGATRCVAFAPGGRLLATGGEDETVRLWDVVTGKLKRGLVGPGGAVTAVVFSPDGKRLASGNDDGTVRVWDVASGEEQRRFEGHRGRVVTLDFSPDGRRLVSGSDDTTAIVWDPDAPGRAVRPVDTAARRLEKLWADLESDDASVAFAAHAALSEVPREAVIFLRHRLPPVSPADPALVVRLIADLGSRRFAAREQAMRELGRLEGQVEQPLRRVLEAKPSAEVEKRLKTLLGRLEAGPSSGPELRAVRAVELLEQLNTGESRLLLDELSRGAAGARLTEEAKAALRRLAKRANADSE